MRFVKKQQLNSKLITDPSVSVEANGQVVLGTNYAVKVPMGSNAERPAYPENGQIRYNTEENEFEFYVNNAWEQARTMRPNTITIQTLGTGNATEQELVLRLKASLAHKTVILITHRGSLLSLVDRVVIIDSGRIMADGPKEQVLNKLASKQVAE